MANDAMRTQWNDVSGPDWVRNEHRFDRMLAPIGAELLRRAAARPGEHVLDVGCGFGSTTLALSDAVGDTGRVMGLDISAPLLDRARHRAHDLGRHNIIWDEADAQVARLPSAHFDLVTSRFGVMFFDQPVAAFHNLLNATKPGGRLCFVCWQTGDKNPWYTFPSRTLAPHVELPPPPPAGGPGPFAFGDDAMVRSVLDTAGYADVAFEGMDTEVVMGDATDDAHEFILRGPIAAALAAAPEAARAAGEDAVRAALVARSSGGEIRFPAAVWFVTARRP